MNILDRAHSLSKLNHKSSSEKTPKTMAKPSDAQSDVDEEGEIEPSDGEYETGSDSSSSPHRPGSTRRSSLGEEHEGVSEPSHVGNRPLSHHPAQARSWYQFDFAVVAALVSPVGHWLTGGDHIKNLLFVLLLLFYLHQIIEIPWTMYHNSRPRVHPHSSRVPAADNFHAKRASSELRFWEFILFSFATFSPLLGAWLLRYVTFAVTGQDVLSWFSIGLFVLATGVRPWSHLVQRLNQRVTDLHDIVHYHSDAKGNQDDVVEMQRELERLHSQMQEMDQAMMKLKKKLTKETNDVYDYVDEQVEPVEKMVKNHEKALEYVLHLPSSLLATRPSKSKQMSPINTYQLPTSKHTSPTHSDTSSPSSTKLETIHEGKEVGHERPHLPIIVPKTVVVKSPPSSPRATRPWPHPILRPFLVVLSLMALPALVFIHAIYAATFPFRWSFRTLLRLSGIEKIVVH
ncbi:hypothetical protein BDP27DRAFT_1223680 [Rhodocollybia butyracea]|uniref:Uncharacterized protein n=1 Tax=Rhodocollybia butyracea TaxID=206335 RepID=A0A9P5PVL7_9AGAR|nr:hypothetical protein BDP27DRAFT_1223680 [Rhodocollybia butyracea]